jgi:hypothetical protein
LIKVFLHTHDKGEANWVNVPKEFAILPSVGEYIATSTDSDWYRVELVVHTPFSCEYDAEVFAVKVNHNEVKEKVFNFK